MKNLTKFSAWPLMVVAALFLTACGTTIRRVDNSTINSTYLVPVLAPKTGGASSSLSISTATVSRETALHFEVVRADRNMARRIDQGDQMMKTLPVVAANKAVDPKEGPIKDATTPEAMPSSTPPKVKAEDLMMPPPRLRSDDRYSDDYTSNNVMPEFHPGYDRYLHTNRELLMALNGPKPSVEEVTEWMKIGHPINFSKVGIWAQDIPQTPRVEEYLKDDLRRTRCELGKLWMAAKMNDPTLRLVLGNRTFTKNRQFEIPGDKMTRHRHAWLEWIGPDGHAYIIDVAHWDKPIRLDKMPYGNNYIPLYVACDEGVGWIDAEKALFYPRSLPTDRLGKNTRQKGQPKRTLIARRGG